MKGGTAEPAAAEASTEMGRGSFRDFAKFVQGGDRVFEIQSGTFLRLVQQSAESGQVVLLEASHRPLHPVGLADDMQGPAINQVG